MSRGADSGEKSHAPTRQRLRDAREQGQVARSQDLTRTAVLAAGAVALIAAAPAACRRLAALAAQAWTAAREPTFEALLDLMASGASTLAWIVLPAVGALALCGALCDFLQAGPLWAAQRIAPDFARLDPAEGVKRLFSLSSLVETGKALLKTALLLGLVAALGLRWLPDLLALATSEVTAVGAVLTRTLVELLGATALIFLLVCFGDLQWQRFDHLRKLRMSAQEVKRERKEHDGDPQLRGQRRRLQRQWASQDLIAAARRASALVVNPTHIAVALQFDAAEQAVPLVSAKGRGSIAAAMRAASSAAGVPIVRNVSLARALEQAVDIDEDVPEDLFDAVAEVLVWADQVRAQAASLSGQTPSE